MPNKNEYTEIKVDWTCYTDIKVKKAMIVRPLPFSMGRPLPNNRWTTDKLWNSTNLKITLQQLGSIYLQNITICFSIN